MDRPPEGRRSRVRRVWGRRLEKMTGLLMVGGCAVAAADGLANPEEAFWSVRLPILVLLTAVGVYTVAVGTPAWLYTLQDLFYGTNNNLRNRSRRSP